MVTRDGEQVREHVALAEGALGRPLPKAAQVHHVDGNPSNNAPGNLVICPSQAYHLLLHVRTDALAACGNASWRKCVHCKEYDAIERLSRHGAREAFYHKACAANYQRNRSQR